MKDVLDHEALKEKQRAIRDGFPETMGLRAHRAISWIGPESCGDDDNARFIFLWMAFNVAYADEREFQSMPPRERAALFSVEHLALPRRKLEEHCSRPGGLMPGL